MCPVCIGSAWLVLTGTGSAGGLTLIAARVLGARPAQPPAAKLTHQIAKPTGSTQNLSKRSTVRD